MWLHVPTTFDWSPSAQEEAASITASDWRCQALAASCSWRGSSTQPADWSRRWRTAIWIRPLFGAICSPSEADVGVASWMASLAASRASRTASPAAAPAAMTSATSGAPPAASSSSPARGGASSRTYPACSPRSRASSLVRSESAETYTAWVGRLRADYSARRSLASRTRGNASSSSAWPTPVAADDGRKVTVPTHQGACLLREAARWAPPDAAVFNDGQKPDGWVARKAREKLKGYNGNGGGTPLAMQATLWVTPSVAASEGGQTSRSGDRADEPLLGGQAEAISLTALPDPTPSTDGAPSSPRGPTSPRRRLNPIFVSWLMGWDVPAPTNSGFAEMGSSRWSQAMRSALSRIALPPAAPPAQRDLFR